MECILPTLVCCFYTYKNGDSVPHSAKAIPSYTLVSGPSPAPASDFILGFLSRFLSTTHAQNGHVAQNSDNDIHLQNNEVKLIMT